MGIKNKEERRKEGRGRGMRIEDVYKEESGEVKGGGGKGKGNED